MARAQHIAHADRAGGPRVKLRYAIAVSRLGPRQKYARRATAARALEQTGLARRAFTRSRRSTRCGLTAPRSGGGSAAAGTTIDASNVDAWDFPRGTRAVEGVHLRPPGRDAPDRAPRRRILAILDLHMERRGHRRRAGARGRCSSVTGPLRAERPLRRALARRLPRLPRRCAGPRSSASPPCSSRPAAASWIARGACPTRRAALVDAAASRRPALGYLHGNCGHCHNEAGAVAGMDLCYAQSATDAAASARTVQSVFGPREPLSRGRERKRPPRTRRRQR